MTPIATVRASSWPALFDCPHRWYWQNIVGLKSAWSGAALLGTAVHAGTGIFDTRRLNGEAASIEEAVDVSRAALLEKQGEVEWDDKLDVKSADGLSIALTARYCETIAPTRQYAAVELACESLDIATDHGTVRITGTTDRIRVLPDGGMGIADLKTGGRATEKTPDGGRRAVTKGHHLQLGIYTLMAEAASGERLDAPAEIIGLQTTKDAPVATGEVADVKTPLLGTDEAPGIIEIAAGMLKSGVFPPNCRSVLCSARYCAAHAQGKCIYHD
ncbi:MAG: PD-(D/E)XK nuclease family protein [Zoogloeaceae bacterium]|jgi:hypothetical protein|nr:PD-(D/E)XK nuclease family protein [Zoogloeaceae bacterium]